MFKPQAISRVTDTACSIAMIQSLFLSIAQWQSTPTRSSVTISIIHNFRSEIQDYGQPWRTDLDTILPHYLHSEDKAAVSMLSIVKPVQSDMTMEKTGSRKC